MASLRRSAALDAPAGKLFDAIEDPENWPRYVPHVEKALDVQRSERRVGDSFRLIYKVLGISFDELLVVTDYQRPHVYRMRVEGRMKGTQQWSPRTPPNATAGASWRSIRSGWLAAFIALFLAGTDVALRRRYRASRWFTVSDHGGDSRARCGEERRCGNGHHPRRQDVAGDTPAHGAEAVRGPGAHHGAGDDVRRAHRK